MKETEVLSSSWKHGPSKQISAEWYSASVFDKSSFSIGILEVNDLQ